MPEYAKKGLIRFEKESMILYRNEYSNIEDEWMNRMANQKTFQKKLHRMQHRQTKKGDRKIEEKLGNMETRGSNIHLIRVPKEEEEEIGTEAILTKDPPERNEEYHFK